MKRILIIFLLMMTAPQLSAAGDIVIIANTNLEFETLTTKQVIDIYMGRYSVFPNGEKVLPLDLTTRSEKRAQFYEGLVGKSLSEINAYWARLLFSGRATPPLAVSDEQELMNIISQNPSAIGYLDEELVDLNKVKVIARVN